MFTQLNKTTTRAILLLSVAALSACASKVRLDLSLIHISEPTRPLF
jgi:hypothetical protein